MEKSIVSVLAVAGILVSSCRVQANKDPLDEKKEGQNLTDSALKVSLTTDDRGIYKSESLTLSWATLDGATCNLKANGTEIGKALPSKGTLTTSPAADTTYKMACVKGELVGSATASLTLLIEADASLPLLSKADMAAVINLSDLGGDSCVEGKPCYFADLESGLFKKTADGWDETNTLINQLTSSEQARPTPKVVTLDQITITSDEASSVLYGYRGNLADLKLDDTCKASNPYTAESSLDNSATLSSASGTGLEEMSAGLLNVTVFTDLKLMGKARRSVVAKGSQLTATFKNADLTGTISALYQEYNSASGLFSIDKSSVRSSRFSLLSDAKGFGAVSGVTGRAAREQRLIYPPVPKGYVLPARGYGGDDKAFIPTDMYCNVKAQEVAWNPIAAPVWYGPVTDYFPQIASKRIVTGSAKIQCNEVNRGDAIVYSIGPEWTLDKPDAWWFVTDTNWPACGGYECLGKEVVAQTIEKPRWDEIEPRYNYCIDRFKGLDYSTYLFTLIDACRETDIYKNAVKKAQETTDDIAFYKKCVNSDACQAVPFGLSDLQNDFPLEKTQALITIAKNQLSNAKANGQSAILTDTRYSKALIARGTAKLKSIRDNFQQYETLRTSVSANVNGLARYFDEIPAEFSSSDQILKSLDAYDAAFKDLATLAAPSVTKIGCSFSASGKFRQYSSVSLSGLKITPLSTVTRILPSLKDVKVGE